MSQLGPLRAVSLVDSCDFLPFFHPHSHRPLFFPRVSFHAPRPHCSRERVGWGSLHGLFHQHSRHADVGAFFTDSRPHL